MFVQSIASYENNMFADELRIEWLSMTTNLYMIVFRHWRPAHGKKGPIPMKSLYVLLTVLFCVSFIGCGLGNSSSDSSQRNSKQVDSSRSPLEVVNERMDAYNRHDIESFMDNYDERIEVFTYLGKSLGKGKKHLRSIFEPMFQEGVVQVEIHHQIAKDGFVVNHETVKNGDEATEYVSIYEVRDGLIRSVSFVRD